MSLLGFLLRMRDKFGKRFLQFIDVVVDADGQQDVATTMSLLEGVLNLIHTRFPDVKRVVLASDNGSAFLSHCCLVLITFCVQGRISLP
jgi:hypothetical protein